MGTGATRRSEFGGRLLRLVALGSTATVLASCVPPSGPVPERFEGRSIVVPAIDVPGVATARSLDIVAAHDWLDDLAARSASDRAATTFFYGTAALQAVDDLAATARVGALASSRLGALFVSGYFGGVYLRQVLDPGRAAAPASGRSGPAAVLSQLIGGSTTAAIDDAAEGLVRVATTGSDAEVRASARNLAPVLAAVHGYNLGYLEVLLDRAPPGATATGALDCPTTFSCRSEELTLAVSERLGPTLERVAAPPDATWRSWGELVEAVALATVGSGRAVWTGLLAGGPPTAEAHDAVVGLSRGFLQVTQASVLGLTEGAVGDAAIGRVGMLITAALLTWAMSYFVGLAAPDDIVELPALRTPA